MSIFRHGLVPWITPLSLECRSARLRVVLFSQSELVKEAFSDPSFLKQVRVLEAMLRVRARAHSDSGVQPVSSGRAETAHFVAGGWGGSPSRCDPKCGQREGAMARSEDDQLCTVSEIPLESFFDGAESASSTAGPAGVEAIANVAGSCAPVAAGFKGVCSAHGDRDVSGEAVVALDSAGEMKGIIGLPGGIKSDFSKNLADITGDGCDCR